MMKCEPSQFSYGWLKGIFIEYGAEISVHVMDLPRQASRDMC